MTTDGFLLSNAELERRGILHRKGFPESYDRRALLRFVTRVKSGVAEVRAPVYSHLFYDIVPDAEIIVRRPDILIVEGLNVLQPPGPGARLAVSDHFDFTVYVDASASDIERWYVNRFLRLQRGAFQTRSPTSTSTRRRARRTTIARATDLARHQRAQPGAQHPADAGPRVPRAAQGRRPQRGERPPPQGLSVSPRSARGRRPGSAGRSWSGNPRSRARPRRPAPTRRRARRPRPRGPGSPS